MRLATVVLAACAVSFAAADSSADDAPGKPAGPKPLRLALEKDKTYLYRLSETVTKRHDVETGIDGVLSLEQRIDVVWDAGVSLQRVEENGNVVVSLMTDRVRGSSAEMSDKPKSFDSDDPKTPAKSPLLGRAIRVTLSPNGRVLEASAPSLPVKEAVAVGRTDVTEVYLDPAFVKPFAQQFFHELPEPAPRAALVWDQTRALAPDWIAFESNVIGDAFADVSERSTITKVTADAVTATFRARGERELKPSAQPKDLSSISADFEQLKEWLVIGEIRIGRDSGLAELRTSTTTIGTHIDSVRVPGDKLPRPSGVPADDVVTPPVDLTREITTRLELVDVR